VIDALQVLPSMAELLIELQYSNLKSSRETIQPLVGNFMNLYPMLFESRLVEKMWGGRELSRIANKTLPPEKRIGESWEIFDFPPGSVGADARLATDDPAGWTSVRISNGSLAGMTLHQVMLENPEVLLGRSKTIPTPHGPQFPLLIKFLDARQDLSVQVHPPTRYASNHSNAFVKNECWFVMDHSPDARILIGATPGTTREVFAESIAAGTCEKHLNAVKVKKGETFYLPSGTVHALGAGIVAAEVQTPSDTTYRVFDFNRIEPATGKPRTLHVEPALDCIDFNNDWQSGYAEQSQHDATIVRAPQFTLHRRVKPANATTDLRSGPMRVLIFVEGTGVVTGAGMAVAFTQGTTVLLPSSVASVVSSEEQTVWLEAIAV